MARRVSYIFNGQKKEIQFSYDRFRDKHEAVAAAENIDLTQFLKMEEQVKQFAKRAVAIKDYRDNEFKRMGFTDIAFVREEEQ